MSVTAPVNRLIPFSAVDGPGNRTVVFLQGCTFSCKYCHNPETIMPCNACGACLAACPTGAIRMGDGVIRYHFRQCVMCDACIRSCHRNSCPRIRYLTAEESMEEIRKNIPFVRGVTVSGGECTLHRNYLRELAILCRQECLSILLDSNGSYDFSEDPELLEKIDGVMLDVKAWDESEHLRLIGAENRIVKKNLHFLAGCGKLAEVRTVVLPDEMNAEETVRNVSRLLSSLKAGAVPYKLIRFRPMGVREEFKHFRSPGKEELDRLEELARAEGMKQIVQI